MENESKVTIELHIEEVQSIIAVLGDLPSKSNAWPLMMKLQKQLQPQED